MTGSPFTAFSKVSLYALGKSYDAKPMWESEWLGYSLAAEVSLSGSPPHGNGTSVLGYTAGLLPVSAALADPLPVETPRGNLSASAMLRIL